MQHPRPIGPVNNIDAPLGVEMTQGVTAPLGRYRAPVHDGVQVSQTTHVSAPLSVEMTAGAAPARNRAFVFPKIGWSVSQTTHDSAGFSIEMTQGAAQPRFRYRAPFHQGQQGWAVEVDPFGIESTIGSKPDRNRQRLGPRIGQPVSQQTTHTPAPFSIEMIQGVRMPQARSKIEARQRLGWTVPVFPYDPTSGALITLSATPVTLIALTDALTTTIALTAAPTTTLALSDTAVTTTVSVSDTPVTRVVVTDTLRVTA